MPDEALDHCSSTGHFPSGDLPPNADDYRAPKDTRAQSDQFPH